jgi:hypothetical protein
MNAPKYFEQDTTSICSTMRPSTINHAKPARNQLLVDVLAQMLASWCSEIFYMYLVLKVQHMLLQHLRNLGRAEPRIISTLDFMSYCLIWTAKLPDHFDLTFHHCMALVHLTTSCKPSEMLNKVPLSVMEINKIEQMQ